MVVGAGASRAETLAVRIPRPRLWRGTDDPCLYAVIVTLRDRRGVAVDRVRQPLGLRSMRFDPDEGFFLNGKHQVLRGVAVHQDRSERGWAVSRADHEEDFRIIADLGANAVRFAHYPHDEYAYELADRGGLVAWAEIPLVNQVSFDGSPASAALTANARQQLTELIRQNFNHPSIAVWSIANEVDLVATQRHERNAAAQLLGSLNALAKSEDPSRPTTLADCCEASGPPEDARREPIVGITDTVGYNRYFGWYYGDAAQLGPMLDDAHARHPQLPLAVSEYGAGGALTQHTDQPLIDPVQAHGRPHPEEVESAFHERSWAQLRSRSYLWATFVWNLFDFASDSRREGDLTDINDKGLVSYDRRTRKDAFYFYRANWSAQPTLHLASRRYSERPNTIVDVTAYSNADHAALWVNDVLQGETPCGEGTCVWRGVRLSRSINNVRAEAVIAGAKVIDELQWTRH